MLSACWILSGALRVLGWGSFFGGDCNRPQITTAHLLAQEFLFIVLYHRAAQTVMTSATCIFNLFVAVISQSFENQEVNLLHLKARLSGS